MFKVKIIGYKKTIFEKNKSNWSWWGKSKNTNYKINYIVKMPKTNGFEATKEIRKFNKDVIIIAQTAYAQNGYNKIVSEAGCNGYISKPIDKQKLLELIYKIGN